MAITSMPRSALRRLGASAATPLGGLGSAEAAPPRGAMIQVSKALGLFSLGLGVVGAARPAALARTIGLPPIPPNTSVVRFVGIRELVAAGGLLTQPQESAFVWSRVLGDTMDLIYLGAKLRLGQGIQKDRLVPTVLAVAGIGLVDLFTSISLSRRRGLGSTTGVSSTWRRSVDGADEGSVSHRDAITVWKSPAEVYAFWRDFTNLPRFMRHVESVQVLGDRRSRWTVKAPTGRTVTWDAEVVEDRPSEVIAWQSLEGGDVRTSGRVRFTPSPDGQGTEIHVEMTYTPPAGKLGAMVATLFNEDPRKQVHGDLRRFKQVLEIGEVMRSEGALDSTAFPQHPAQASKTEVSKAEAPQAA